MYNLCASLLLLAKPPTESLIALKSSEDRILVRHPKQRQSGSSTYDSITSGNVPAQDCVRCVMGNIVVSQHIGCYLRYRVILLAVLYVLLNVPPPECCTVHIKQNISQGLLTYNIVNLRNP